MRLHAEARSCCRSAYRGGFRGWTKGFIHPVQIKPNAKPSKHCCVADCQRMEQSGTHQTLICDGLFFMEVPADIAKRTLRHSSLTH